MILSNRSRNQEIKSVDTSKVYGSGNLEQADEINLLMDIVNSKTMDMSRLNSPYEIVQNEKKYENIDISDMLNPQINHSSKDTTNMSSDFSRDNAMEEVEKAKLERRNTFYKKMIIFIFVVCVLATVGYVFGSDIVSFIKSLFNK